jgi:ACR3 family arsenite transporter
MRSGSFALGKGIGLGYERTATLALTAAGNDIAELLPG